MDLQSNILDRLRAAACPLPSGMRGSLRPVHYFEFDEEGRISRDNGYALWRRVDAALHDDIPAPFSPSVSISR